MFLYSMMIILLLVSAFSGMIVLLGKNKWDRFLGFSMVSAKVNILIVLWAFFTAQTFYLDVALIFIVLNYIGVIVLADYISRRSVK